MREHNAVFSRPLGGDITKNQMRMEEHKREAEKWKTEGDMYGWNYHQGMAMAYNEMELDISEAQNDKNNPLA